WVGTGFSAAPFPAPPVRAARFLPATLARLKRGVTLEQAQQKLDLVATQLRTAYPNDYQAKQRWSIRIEPAQASLTHGVRTTLIILLSAVSFVLLIVCVNMASLMLARASARARELAVRHAIGASRARLVRQLLTESILISLTGGLGALALLRFARG